MGNETYSSPVIYVFDDQKICPHEYTMIWILPWMSEYSTAQTRHWIFFIHTFYMEFYYFQFTTELSNWNQLSKLVDF